MNTEAKAFEQPDAEPTKSKDRPFQPFRTPRSEAARKVVVEITRMIENYEWYKSVRKRSRRPADQEIFEQTIAAVVCDLIHRYRENPTGRIAISLSNRDLGRRSRYRSPAMGKRRDDLIIEGEGAAELDYGQMALRTLYGKAKATPPTGDLYNIPGLTSREGVKKIINAALFSDTRQSRMPQGVRQLFPRNITYERALSAIEEHHCAISGFFFKGIGMELMFLESEIMVDVLLRCRDQGLVALPIHDAVMTPTSKTHLVKAIMETTFLEKTGVEADVRVEGVCQRQVSDLVTSTGNRQE